MGSTINNVTRHPSLSEIKEYSFISTPIPTHVQIQIQIWQSYGWPVEANPLADTGSFV